MDPLFKPFEHVARVEVPDGVYARIRERIAKRERRQRLWLRAAAAAAVLVWASQAYLMWSPSAEATADATQATQTESYADLFVADNDLFSYE